MNNKYYLALDLKDDPDLISEYERWHLKENSWPEIMQSIKESGVEQMEIYRTGNRLFMVIEASEQFDPKVKAEMDMNNPVVQKWEKLMLRFQQPLPWAKQNEKWVEMKKIFALSDL